ncbi:MAG TPA: hypothetical protein VIG44_01405, partial [Thermomicrobiales bacterium]
LAGLSSQPDGGLGWWWHTPDDTLDKIDSANFVRDTQVYLLTCWRLCTLSVLPFDYTEAANELRDRLHELQESANGRFDLTPLLVEVDRLHADAERLNAAAAKAGSDAAHAERINAALMVAAHALIPVNYTLAGPYGVDLALENPILPGLAPIATLAELDPASNDAGFLRTRLVRERNRALHALTTARRAIALSSVA